jgi:hypothetical protein
MRPDEGLLTEEEDLLPCEMCQGGCGNRGLATLVHGYRERLLLIT